MSKSFEHVSRNRRISLAIVYGFIAFMSCFVYPIVPTNLYPYERLPLHLILLLGFVRLQMLYACFYISKLLSIIFQPRKRYVFSTIFISNTIGLLIRIALEWGESTMMKELTPLNIIIHLFQVIRRNIIYII